ITGSTSVTAGSVVHDEATVLKALGTSSALPNPTGTVTFTLWNSTSCTGTVLATSTGTLNASGVASSDPFTVPAGGGTFGYSAHYNGAGPSPGHDATNPACESFSSPVQVFAGCTPGFWKNHGLGLWNQGSDTLAVTVGFLTTTKFNTYFGLTPAQSGFANSV